MTDESKDPTDPTEGSPEPEDTDKAPFELRKRPTKPAASSAAADDTVEVQAIKASDEAADQDEVDSAGAAGDSEGDPDVSDAADQPAELGQGAGSQGPGLGEVSSNSGSPRVGTLAWVLLAVALVAVVMTFLSWRDADGNSDLDRAAMRDRALIEGTAAVETMTSMDHRDVAAGIAAWQEVSTGVLHDQLVSVGDDEQQMLADQGKIASGRVVQSALTELTDRTATLITAVEVTVKSEDETEEPAVKRNRFSADLVLVSGHWKIENLQQVAVNV